MNEQLISKCKKYQNHFSELFKVPCNIVEIPEDGVPCLRFEENACSFCDHCNYDQGRDDLLAISYYGCNEANRWNGKYVYYCPMGLVFIASSISIENGGICGGLVLYQQHP